MATAGAHDHPLRRALPWFLLAGLCLSSLDATAKYLVRDHPLLLVVWARYVGQLLFVTPYVHYRAGSGFWRTRKLRLHLVRSLFLVLATAFFFGALRYIPLAEGSAVNFLAPIFMVVLARPVIGERPPRARFVASIVGFAGIVVILRPGSAVLHPAVLLVVLAAACNALYQLLTRKLLDENPNTTLFYSAVVGAATLTLLLPWAWPAETVQRRAIPAFVLLGAFAGVGHFLLTRAFLRAPAALLAPFTYLQMLWATLYGVILFGQHPDLVSALGMTIVVASGLGLAVYERSRYRLL
jgi:drug/metabolite transporter (DMT)-like permease